MRAILALTRALVLPLCSLSLGSLSLASLSLASLPLAFAQPMRAVTALLSVCGVPPSIDVPSVTSVLLSKDQPSVRGMVSYCSNNKASFSAHVIPQTINISCGPFERLSCDVDSWARKADQFMSQQLGLDLGRFDHRIYVLPHGDMCGFGGLGTVGPCNSKGAPCRVWISGLVPQQIQAYFHELGHNLGLMHASYNNDQYGDFTSGMGYCCAVRCFAAPHMHALRWSNATRTITTPVVQQSVALKPYGYVIIKDARRRETYFVQFRKSQNSVYEAGLSTTAVYVYQQPDMPHPYTALQGVLTQAGHVWENRHSIRVTLTSFKSDTAIIRVEPSKNVAGSIGTTLIPLLRKN